VARVFRVGGEKGVPKLVDDGGGGGWMVDAQKKKPGAKWDLGKRGDYKRKELNGVE